MKSWRDLTVNNINDANIIIASVSYDLSASVSLGASLAPNKLRELSYHLPPATKDGEPIGVKLYDVGDIGSNVDSLDNVYREAKAIFSYKKFPIFIGGDHSVSIPIQKAFFEYANSLGKIPAIIHIDAHPDFCNEYKGSKLSHACTNYRAYENGYSLSDIILIGIRGYELQEIELFKKNKEIKIYNTSDILEKNINVFEELKKKFDDRYLIYLSFDIDSIDPSFAPGTGTPEAFGLSSNYVNKLINDIIEHLSVGAWDIVEVSPSSDINDITSWLALKIMYEVFHTISKK